MTLLGPSGSGKTKLLMVLAGFIRPDSGSVRFGDREVIRLAPHKRDIGIVFQNYALFPHMTIADNIAYGLAARGVPAAEQKSRVAEMLALIKLEHIADRYPKQLSGGQQQRVALARALVNRPQVLLLDEPLGALDLKLRKQMQLELKAIQHDIEITFIHVTHDQEEAMTMADRIAVMNGGRIEQLGAPTELYENPQTAFVAGFLGASNLIPGDVNGPESVRLRGGPEVLVPRDALAGRSRSVAVGIRPEKIELGDGQPNRLEGAVVESAYVGVATQYIVETTCGRLTVYVQNAQPGGVAAVSGRVTLSWSPEATFVVDSMEEDSE
jgi:spermidine/putrescine transport system ATP-binding protein